MTEIIAKSKSRQQFEEYHLKNPQMYSAIETVALQYLTRRERTGIARIFEDLRWNRSISASDDNFPFKICNTYKPFYARLLIQKHPELAEIIELRAQKAKNTNE